MITFLPFADYTLSAQCLDRKRLQQQRREARHILTALLANNTRWANHPAERMWAGNPYALALYGLAMCVEWKQRGYRDNVGDLKYFAGWVPADRVHRPWWLEEQWARDLVLFSHREALRKKDPAYYRPRLAHIPASDENDKTIHYAWPGATRADGVFYKGEYHYV